MHFTRQHWGSSKPPFPAELPASPIPHQASGSSWAKPHVPHLLYSVSVSTGKCLCCCCHPKGLTQVMRTSWRKRVIDGLLLDTALTTGEVHPDYAAFQQGISIKQMSSAYLGDS